MNNNEIENNNNVLGECARCDHVLTSDSRAYEVGEELLCEECYEIEKNNGDILTCEECGNDFYTENMEEVLDEDGDTNYYICDECYSTLPQYARCSMCERCYNINDLNDDYECPNCRYEDDEDEETGINENGALLEGTFQTHVNAYHSPERPPYRVLKLDSEKSYKYTLGWELETDTCNENEEAIFDYLRGHKNPLGLWLERDGSLSHNGIEFISQPMTKKYFKAHQKWLKEFLEFLTSIGYKSHDAGGCGLHFHYSKPSENIQNKIMFVFATYTEEIIKISRRTCFDYCSTRELGKNIEYQALNKIKEKGLKGYFHGHGGALNFENSNTIEFRIMRGTLNFNSFIASWEFLDNLYNLCLTSSVESITFEKLTKTRFIRQYCLDKDIYSIKTPRDFSKVLEDKEKLFFQKRINVVKKLQTFLNYVKSDKTPSVRTFELMQRIFNTINCIGATNDDVTRSYLNDIKRYINEYSDLYKYKSKFNSYFSKDMGEV